MPSPPENQPVPLRLLTRPRPAGGASSACRVPVDELLTARFLARHTRFPSFAALLAASGFSVERFSKLEGRKDRSWDDFIRGASDYADWSGMLHDARGEWMLGRLGIVIDG